MPQFGFTFTPESLAYADKPGWISATDGDTPSVSIPIRMLGMDAPELHYAGATESNPGKFDKLLAGFLKGAGKNLPAGLRSHLRYRIRSNASTRQIRAGMEAFDHFQSIVKERLDRGVGGNGKPLTPRKLFTMASKDVFDHYGRLLAYVNAAYSAQERDRIPLNKRPTFNLQMVQDGHAVSLIIFPNIPKASDLELVRKAVRTARIHGKGMWKDGEKVLLPYEFRWIIDTINGKREGPDRYCADMMTGTLYPPQGYYRVLPENRVFFFANQVGDALGMGFTLVQS